MIGSDKPIAYHDSCYMLIKIMPFDIAAEIQVSRFEEFKPLFGRVVTFDVFFANREESNGRPFEPEHLLGKNGAHDSKLQQILGRRIDVSPSDAHNEHPLFRWEQTCYRWTLNTAQCSELQYRGRNRRISLAC